MKILAILFLSFSLIACHQNDASRVNNTNLDKIIEYLKSEFHVRIDSAKINDGFKGDLIKQHISLESDSLIKSRIVLSEYEPLHISFIRFNNYFGEMDSTHQLHFELHLIEDHLTGKFYKDYVNPNTGMNTEPICMFSSIDNNISLEKANKDISRKNLISYNSIHAQRIFGENEFKLSAKKQGLQSYLNDACRFHKPTKAGFDSLFFAYDKFYYFSDTLINIPGGLFDFLSYQSERLRSEPLYVGLASSLRYLKEQVNLLLLQTENKNENSLFWIYKNDRNLRVRRLLITGNDISTYSYFLDEYKMCFY